MLESVVHDFRYALRTLRRSPGFAAAAVLSLALGIGANTTIFTLVNALLLRPIAASHPEQLVSLYTSESDGKQYGASSYPDYRDFTTRTDLFTGLAATQMNIMSLSREGRAQRVLGVQATGNYFTMLGVRPELGRLLRPQDDTPGSAPVAVLSHAAWTRRFGADPAIVGRTLVISGRTFTIAGVASEDFRGSLMGLTPDLWVTMWHAGPALPGGGDFTRRGDRGLLVIGRLRPGVTVADAQKRLAVLFQNMGSRDNDDRSRRVSVLAERDSRVFPAIRGPVTAFMALLMVIVALVLLVACANVAGLQLARWSRRGREIGIRLALGATRGRLLRQLLTESLVLGIAGGIGGVLLALWGTDLVMAFQPPLPFEVNLDLHPDGRVLLFSLVVSLVTGVVFGLAPALQATRGDVFPSLKEGAAGGRGRSRLRNTLVIAQIALSLLLLVAAGLVVRGLVRAQAIQPGFDADKVASLSFDLKLHGYNEDTGRAFYDRLMERARALPGVEAVSLDHVVPMTLMTERRGLAIEGYNTGPQEHIELDSDVVGPDYFRTMGIRVARGRGITAADGRGAPAVAVVNETFARRYWPGKDPLGRRINFDTSGGVSTWITVVGVAADSKYHSVGEDPMPHFYTAYAQEYQSEMALLVRSAHAASLLGPLRQAARSLDPNIGIYSVGTLEQNLGTSLLPSRLAASLLGLFGGLALLLSAIGLYGVVAYSVTRRTQEFGVRMALGARQRDVIVMVLREAVTLVGVGGALGLALALAASRLLTGVLNGVNPLDPLAYAGPLLLLAAATLVASYVPAQRASRVDPMVALRAE